MSIVEFFHEGLRWKALLPRVLRDAIAAFDGALDTSTFIMKPLPPPELPILTELVFTAYEAGGTVKA